MQRFKAFFQQETVLCIAAVCAVLTMFLVPPDGQYPGYIDLRVLCLLLCLMAVVAGIQSCGAFQWLAAQLLKLGRSGRTLGLLLVMLPFFTAMLVTNDVALLTFVPFTLLLLKQLHCESSAISVLVLQTMAANLGSMATPVGNPQNLYLYGAYQLSAGQFFSAVLPIAGVSLVGLGAAALLALPHQLPELPEQKSDLEDPKKLAAFLVLFFLCLLTVFRVLPYGILTVIVLTALAFLKPKLLRGLDICLLLTFVCFFIVSGNLGRVEAVRTTLQALMARSTLLTAAATSQIISNVPAAVLLSGFTDAWKPLLQGVNIGGLGTPIASLASLITLKLYLRWEDARPSRFVAVFLIANLIGLGILLFLAMML